jgi:translocation and assembly module TamA
MHFYMGLLGSNYFIAIRYFWGLGLFLLLTSLSFASSINQSKEVSVVLTGITGELLKNAEAHLPRFTLDCHASLEAITRYKRTIKRKLGKSLHALGYYHAKFAIKVIQDKGCLHIAVKVVEGKPVIVQAQNVLITGMGRHEEAFHILLKKRPYQINDILNHQHYTAYKKTFIEKAQELGYLKAHFANKQIEINKLKHSASITLHFHTGKHFKYGLITVIQNVLSENVMRKFIILKTGKRFSSTTLIRQQQILQNSGYYNVVNVRPDFGSISNKTIPITIELTPRKRTGYLARFGYGTDTGFRAKATMERRWTGSSGKRLLITTGLSERINDVNFQLTLPRNDPEHNSLFYTLGFKQDTNDDVDSKSIKAGILSTSMRSNEWKRTLSFNYLQDTTKVEGSPITRSSLALLGIQYSHVEADNRLFPENGWRLRFEAEGAVDQLFSDASLLQLKAHGKYISKVGKGRIIARADFGTTFGDSLDDLPKDLRFFAGGNNSIRGFSYESLGEINTDNKVIGGKQLIETSLEYEHPIFDKWSLAGFVDAGNAFDDFDLSNVEVGIGMGLRWRSPIGPIRFDIAQPVDDLSDTHLHLSIGPDL